MCDGQTTPLSPISASISEKQRRTIRERLHLLIETRTALVTAELESGDTD